MERDQSFDRVNGKNIKVSKLRKHILYKVLQLWIFVKNASQSGDE